MFSCSSFPSHSLIAYSLLIFAIKVDPLLDQIPTDTEANGIDLASNLKEILDADVRRVMTGLHALLAYSDGAELVCSRFMTLRGAHPTRALSAGYRTTPEYKIMGLI